MGFTDGRPVVLLDCDGPMARFAEAYLKLLAEETGREHSVDEIEGWHIRGSAFFKEAARALGVSPESLDGRICSRITEAGFCLSIEPCPQAKKAVPELLSMANVYVVTSPWASSPTWMYERTKWLREHFEISASRVIHAASKYPVHGDVIVDDKPEHVEAWGRQWTDGSALLYDMPHNRKEGAGLQRVSWDQVLDVVWARSVAGRLLRRAVRLTGTVEAGQ